MFRSHKKTIAILIGSLMVSVIFYISQLFYVSIENQKSSKVYVQSLSDAIDKYTFLPLLIAEHHLVQNVFYSPSLASDSTSAALKDIAEQTEADDIYLMDLTGKVIASSNYQTKNSFINQNYHFRPYFKSAINEQSRQFYYAKGATTGIPGFFISMPVFIDTVLHGVAVVKLEPDRWEESWQNSEETIIVADENNIVLLSTNLHWRYKSIGQLDQQLLNNIKAQQQFPGADHKSLYSRAIQWPFSSTQTNSFWIIERSLFLVNSFKLPTTNWKLYHLQKHDVIFNSSVLFFLILSLLSLLAYFVIKGRIHIAESYRKHELLELKQKEELQKIIDNIHIGIIITKKTGDILSANHYAENLLIKKSEHKNREPINIDDLLSTNIFQHSQHKDALSSLTTKSYTETTTIFPTNNPIPIMFSVKNINIMKDDVYLLTIIDITKRKIAENELININESLEDIVIERTKELEKTQDKLIQQNKVAALGNMAATIVHELSQPLTAMNSSIGAIRAKIDHKDYDGALDSANRLEPLNHKMHAVIKLLKSFSYDDKNTKNQTDLRKLLQSTLNSFNDIFSENNISIIFKPNNSQHIANVDSIKMDLVFSNIIQNAIDATEENDYREIEIKISDKDNMACIDIIDNGQGVTGINMKQMFSSYFTTKEVGKGLGLGLAICYEIIQEYEGSISAETINNRTCFTIQLPLESTS